MWDSAASAVSGLCSACLCCCTMSATCRSLVGLLSVACLLMSGYLRDVELMLFWGCLVVLEEDTALLSYLSLATFL